MIIGLWITVFLVVLLCALIILIPDWDRKVFQFLKEAFPKEATKSKLDRYKILKKENKRR